MSEPFKPDQVIGVYCFTYPGHEGKNKFTCDHCVELIPKYLTPEAQLALQEGQAYREMWAELRLKLLQAPSTITPQQALNSMALLESQPAKEGE